MGTGTTGARADRGSPREGGTLSLSVSCKEVSVAQWARGYLEANGVVVGPRARASLLLDFPTGWAMRELEANMQGGGTVIVATRNPCAEYLEDLWDLGPAGLLSLKMVRNQGLVETLGEVEARLAEGGRYRLTPHGDGHTGLGDSERCALRYMARGWGCDRIAEHMGMEEQSVRNSLRKARAKLGLGSRAEMILYYWGLGAPF